MGLETLVAMVGFQTAKAQHYAFEASNHHKSWDIRHIYFQAILQLQICDYTKTTPSPTAPEFFHWIHLQPNLTHRYVHHITLRSLTALFMFRQGVRGVVGVLTFIGWALHFGGTIFYTKNCRTYIEVQYRDILTRSKAPPQVLAAIQQNESFSETGNLIGGRGGGGGCLRGKK